MELNEYILKKAIASGICEGWAERISKVEGVEELLQMYVDGIDFCLEKNFPSNNDLVNLGGDRLAEYGIHVDEKIKGILRNPKFKVLLGLSYIEAHNDGFSVAQYFIKHSSKATILASDNSFVVIDCFDSSTLYVHAHDSAKVLVNIYGDAKVEQAAKGAGIIKIVHKNKSTY